MDRWGLLLTTEAYDLVLEAVVHIPAVGAHYTTYNDMTSADIEPDLTTFHHLLDGTLSEGSVKNTKKAAFYLWRRLMKEWPRIQPDIELMNKLIRCCIVCGDHERGLVFLSALTDCSVEPNVRTFTLLLKVSSTTISWKLMYNVYIFIHVYTSFYMYYVCRTYKACGCICTQYIHSIA